MEVDGRWYLVGEQAQLQSASASQTLDATRTGTAEQKALFYAAASELIRGSGAQVRVVSGLPVADFEPRVKAALRKMLMGQHQIKQLGARTHSLEVVDVTIVPQAMGSLFSLVLNRRGQLVDKRLASGRVGIVDIGTLTTNHVLVDRLRYVEVGSDSVTTGMSEMLLKVAKDLRRECGLDWALQRNCIGLSPPSNGQ